jgi:uncharacterized 2Fe-2S/4Fe-4S cluster protein (DUF4445 family)
MSYLIEFEPVGRRGTCSEGLNLLECARFLGVGLVSICGGFGKCKACKIRLLNGQVSAPSPVETGFFSPAQIQAGWRLACLTYPQSDCTVHVPPESLTTLQRMQVESRDIFTAVQPAVRTYPVDLPAPTFLDLRADDARLLDSLVKQHSIDLRTVDIDVLRSIALTLRDNQWRVSAAVRHEEIIALNSPGVRSLGFAVDVGTTKIAGYLVDLVSGQTLASKGLMNPQINFGEDITSRIHHALKSSDEASALQQVVVAALNQLVGDLCQEAGVKTGEVVDASIVGNTAMHHLLYRLPVYPLAYPPFNASVQNTLDIKARDLGLQIAPGAYVHTLPNIAGFVGADHVAMLVAIDALAINELTVAIDIGTNTEVSAIDRGAIYSASCASGPAFEGGHISCGMRAAGGAIERLRLEGGAVQMQTIGSTPPVGICGSGIIDSVAQLYQAGVLSESGRMQERHPGVRTKNGQREFVLFAAQGQGSDIVITQKDVREIQLGKGAIRAGIQVLLEAAGRREEDIRHVVIAGAFGTYIDVGNAILLGLLPSLPLDRFQQIGNAAGLGARQALLSVEKRARENEIAARMKYIELAGTPSFNAIFIQTQYLGQYRIVDRQRVKIE